MPTARSQAAKCALASLLALLACGEEPTPPLETAESAAVDPRLGSSRPRGLWVLCEGSQRVLEHPERIDDLIEYASAIAATDLFVQVYRGGQAWFDSSYAGVAPYQQIRKSTGLDTLRELTRRAHLLGIRVHAWVNVLSLANHRDAKIVTEIGREAVLVDRRGRSILDYPNLEIPEPDRSYYRMGTPAVWLDPAAPGVAEYLTATFAELMTRYPELDGLHLDYIRYPGVLPFAPGSRFGVGLDFGYGDSTRARFKAETGLVAPMGDSLRNANRWDEWRREKMYELVGGVRTAVLATRPEAAENQQPLVSAAVGAYAERVYLAEAQDWKGWIEAGLLDFAVPMAYSLDDRMFRYMVEGFASSPRADRIWIGHGTWLFAKRPDGALKQLETMRSAGARGEVLFSYDSIADAPALREALLAYFGEPTGED
ncbi:MAG: family 10 glycosylhydrolase [Deltaproteobacteria bacterium]|nr:family 10 glycosylhydrolase [Deltaproteobacteria bacterium]